MTMMEFTGCTFIAFGLPFAMFLFTIARDPLRVIVFMASAFFWLVSLLLSSLLWYIVPIDNLAFGLSFSVVFQEVFRLCFFLILKKADEGLKKVSERENTGEQTITLVNNKHLMAYVSGFGYGVICGAFSLINVLADMTGPGTIGIRGDNENFFIVSALLTLCFIMLHTFWGVIFFHGMDKKNYFLPVIVGAFHMLVSCLTLLNQMDDPMYYASVIPAYVVMVLMGVWAFFVAGGSREGLKAFFANKRRSSYNLD